MTESPTKRLHVDSPTSSPCSMAIATTTTTTTAATPKNIIYLDHLSTTPLCKEACEAMKNMLSSEDTWGNPSSTHSIGRKAKQLLDTARMQVAELVNAPNPDTIVFESCATETINHAILGTLAAANHQRRHIVTSAIEHPAVAECISHCTTHLGCTSTLISPQIGGRIDAKKVAEAVQVGETLLVSIMLANNELGSINPIKEIVHLVLAKDPNVVIHVDASQAVGKIHVNVQDLKCHLLTIAAHKLYGPKGIAALYVAPGIKLGKLFFGAGQERGARPGTENVLLAVGFGAAAVAAQKMCLPHQEQTRATATALFHQLQDEITIRGMEVFHNGPPQLADLCLPGALSVSFLGSKPLIGHDIATQAASRNVLISSGPACHAGDLKPSAILLAAGVPRSRAASSIRMCVDRHTTLDDVTKAVAVIVDVITSLQ